MGWVPVALPLIVPGWAIPAAHAQPQRLLVAYYYAWYDRTTWRAGITPDLPARLYDSADASTIQRHIVEARRSGIDAFNVAWLGPSNPTDRNLRLMLENAQPLDFRASIGFETDSSFFRTRDEVVAVLRYAIRTYTDHPAYLRYEGRPVVFFWRLGSVPLGGAASALDAWTAVRAEVDPDHQVLWIGEGDRFEYLRVFDGIHPYSVAWAGDVRSTLISYGNSVRQQAATLRARKLWVATVMPGYDDTRTGRPDAFARDRHGVGFYQETWAGAVASNPDLIIITSWNEWVEGSQIEPSQSYGNLYLEATRSLSSQWKGPPRELPTEAVALIEEEAAIEDCDVPGRIRGVPAVRLPGGDVVELASTEARGAVPIRKEPSERARPAGAWKAGDVLTTHYFLPGKKADGGPVTWRLVLGPEEECGWIAYGLDALAGEAGPEPALMARDWPDWLLTWAHDFLGLERQDLEDAVDRLSPLASSRESLLWPLAILVGILLLLRRLPRR